MPTIRPAIHNPLHPNPTHLTSPYTPPHPTHITSSITHLDLHIFRYVSRVTQGGLHIFQDPRAHVDHGEDQFLGDDCAFLRALDGHDLGVHGTLWGRNE